MNHLCVPAGNPYQIVYSRTAHAWVLVFCNERLCQSSLTTGFVCVLWGSEALNGCWWGQGGEGGRGEKGKDGLREVGVGEG